MEPRSESETKAPPAEKSTGPHNRIEHGKSKQRRQTLNAANKLEDENQAKPKRSTSGVNEINAEVSVSLNENGEMEQVVVETSKQPFSTHITNPAVESPVTEMAVESQCAPESAGEQDETEEANEEMEEKKSGSEAEDENREMTNKEKQAMYQAVKEASIDTLEELLDLPHADINMIWFNENLLMAAIKSKHADVAEFLIDNGVDRNFETTTIHVHNSTKKIEWTRKSCRQVAYDHNLLEIVELIDHLNGELWPFIKCQREPRLRRSPSEREIKPRTVNGYSDSESDESDSDGSSGSENEEGKDAKEEGSSDSSTVTSADEQDGGEQQSEKKIRKKKRKGKRKKRRRSTSSSSVSKTNNDETGNGENTNGDKADDTEKQTSAEDGKEDTTEEEKRSFTSPSDDGYQTGSSLISLYGSETSRKLSVSPRPRTYQRKTKTFYSRLRENKRIFYDRPKDVFQIGIGSPVHAVGSYATESRLWTPDSDSASLDSSRKDTRQTLSPMRVISPYKEDDPETLKKLKKRSFKTMPLPLSSYSVHVRSKSEILRKRLPTPASSVEKHLIRSSPELRMSPMLVKNLSDVSINSTSSTSSLGSNMEQPRLQHVRSSSSNCYGGKKSSPAGLLKTEYFSIRKDSNLQTRKSSLKAKGYIV